MKQNAATVARELKIDKLAISIHPSNEALGKAAAAEAAAILGKAITTRGDANAVLATGNSQITFLTALRNADVDWGRVRIFHLDEYVGIDPGHSASFPNFLRTQLFDYVEPLAFHPLHGASEDLVRTCRDYETLLRSHPADLCALGIGENGHLAFNDPPFADFDDPRWVKVVDLADASRRQQVRERHFASLAEVPRQAITMTIPAILAAQRLLVMVPERRKVQAIRHTVVGKISEQWPSSILRTIDRAHLYLDENSAAGLDTLESESGVSAPETPLLKG